MSSGANGLGMAGGGRKESLNFGGSRFIYLGRLGGDFVYVRVALAGRNESALSAYDNIRWKVDLWRFGRLFA